MSRFASKLPTLTLTTLKLSATFLASLPVSIALLDAWQSEHQFTPNTIIVGMFCTFAIIKVLLTSVSAPADSL